MCICVYYHNPPGAKLIRQPMVERHVGHHGDGQTAPETTATLDVMGQREPVRAARGHGICTYTCT